MDFTTLTDEKRNLILQKLSEIFDASGENTYVKKRARECTQILTNTITVKDAEVVKKEN